MHRARARWGQDSLLFNTFVRDNIRMGQPSATDAEVEHAARAAEIHTSILDLPRGYDTCSIVGAAEWHPSGG